MSAVYDGRCSPWVMCSVVSGSQIHNSDRDIEPSTIGNEFSMK